MSNRIPDSLPCFDHDPVHEDLLPREKRVTIFTAGPSLTDLGSELTDSQENLPSSNHVQSSRPKMSLTTATTVVIKSARFSPHRRQHFIPLRADSIVGASGEGTKDRQDGGEDASLPPFPSLLRPRVDSRGGMKSNSAVDLLPVRIEAVGSVDASSEKTGRFLSRRSSSVTGNGTTTNTSTTTTAASILTYSPLSAKPVEFATCSSTTPSHLEQNEESCPAPTPTLTPIKHPGAGGRRKSLVRSAIAFAGNRRESLANLFNEIGETPPSTPPIHASERRRKFSIVPALPSASHFTHTHRPSHTPNPPPAGNNVLGSSMEEKRRESRTSSAGMSNPDELHLSTNAPTITALVNGSTISSISYLKSFFRKKTPSMAMLGEGER